MLALVTACFPYGFSGGGLPSHVKTLAVLPFENQTPSASLQQELVASMRREMERRLGLRDAPEARADAIVRGTLVRYDVDVPISFTADPNQATTARRMLQVTVDVELVDSRSGKALWQRKGLVAQGEYSESEESEGRRRAIERVVNEVIEGAQSQW
ncbi:MAG: LPS assembly lipoprotein LptE [Gemmatimonadaceae bacterium]